MQLLCCADLTIGGASGGTCFFQRDSEARPTEEVACLQLGYVDNIRVILLPESEIEAFGRILFANSVYMAINYEVNPGGPWKQKAIPRTLMYASLVISMLGHMESNG